MKRKTCCFIGHRFQSFAWEVNESDPRCDIVKNHLREEILRMIIQWDVRHFICAMDRGVNTWAAEIVLEMKESYPVTLECAISHEEQASQWEENDRERYFYIIQRADDETMMQTRYTTDCAVKCNRYMIDHSNYAIATVLDPLDCTDDALQYAKEKRAKIVLLEPKVSQLVVLK